MNETWGTHRIEVALGKKYCDPEYAFLPQARNRTGYGGDVRTADALAMSLWPSRGIHLYGFEIKASRSDWLAELKNPAKADEIARFCNFWFLVVGAKEIVRAGELPPSWGLIAPKGDRLVIVSEAKENKTVATLTMPFLAGILRKASEVMVDPGLTQEAANAAQKEGFRSGQKSREFEISNLEAQISKTKSEIAEFERTSGIRVSNTWNAGSLGSHVAKAMQTDWRRYEEMLDRLRLQAINIAGSISSELKSMPSGEMCDWVI